MRSLCKDGNHLVTTNAVHRCFKILERNTDPTKDSIPLCVAMLDIEVVEIIQIHEQQREICPLRGGQPPCKRFKESKQIPYPGQWINPLHRLIGFGHHASKISLPTPFSMIS